jgi:ABC-type proline/glycine betaine transport system permease subunit
MTGTTTSDLSGDSRARRDFWNSPATAMAVVVVASTVVAVLAPDMVTGSTHEHLPLAALTIWPWTAAAVGYVFTAGRRNDSRDLVLGVTFVWTVVAVLALAVPTMVTGTDPTRIPLSALIAPPFGAVVTGFLAISHARASSGTREVRTSVPGLEH